MATRPAGGAEYIGPDESSPISVCLIDEALMKMLHIVCGEKLEQEVLALLRALGIKAYTVVGGVGGSGLTGTVSGTGSSIDRNTLFMVGIEDAHIHMTEIVNGVREIHARHVHGYRGLEIPLKVFLLECEVLL